LEGGVRKRRKKKKQKKPAHKAFLVLVIFLRQILEKATAEDFTVVLNTT